MAEEKNITPLDSTLESIGKMLPAQATAAFLGVRAVVDLGSGPEGAGSDPTSLYIVLGCIVFIAAVTPIASKAFLGIKNVTHQIVLAITFVIWALNIEYARLHLLDIGPTDLILRLTPVVLMIWALLILPLAIHFIKQQNENFTPLAADSNQ